MELLCAFQPEAACHNRQVQYMVLKSSQRTVSCRLLSQVLFNTQSSQHSADLTKQSISAIQAVFYFFGSHELSRVCPLVQKITISWPLLNFLFLLHPRASYFNWSNLLTTDAIVADFVPFVVTFKIAGQLDLERLDTASVQAVNDSTRLISTIIVSIGFEFTHSNATVGPTTLNLILRSTNVIQIKVESSSCCSNQLRRFLVSKSTLSYSSHRPSHCMFRRLLHSEFPAGSDLEQLWKHRPFSRS